MLDIAPPSSLMATTTSASPQSKHCTAAAKAQFKYVAIIDAGSSGTRLFIYRWRYPFKKTLEEAGDLLNLELIFKGDTEETSGNDGKGGIHHQTPDTMKRYLSALLIKGAAELRGCNEVPIYLLATGGMRGITDQQQQKDIMIAAHDEMIFARRGGDTTKDEGGNDDDDIFNPGGPNTNALIITGEEEGLLGWTALNYGRSGDHSEPIVGLHEMGGASIQIAYRKAEEAGVTKKVCLVSGDYHVRSITRDGFGADDINRDRVMSLPGYGDGAVPCVFDPCLPRDRITILNSAQKLMGTGRLDHCLQWTATTLAAKAPANPHANSLPKYDTIRAGGTEYFLGIATYQYTYEFFGQLGNYGKERLYDPRLFDAAVQKYCIEKPWGELPVKFNKFVDAQCFKAAWMKMLLHNPTHGFGMPRRSDETWKGIFRFPMQVELDSRSTWTVGAAVLIAREGELKLCEDADEWGREDDDEEEEVASRFRVPAAYNTTLVLAPGVTQIVAPSLAAARDSPLLLGCPIHLVAFSTALLLAVLTFAYRRIRSARAAPSISLSNTDMKSVV